MAATAATAMWALMARMQPWPGQLVGTELTVASAALAAQVAKAVLAVRVQKPVLIQPVATAAQAAWGPSAAMVVAVRRGRVRKPSAFRRATVARVEMQAPVGLAAAVELLEPAAARPHPGRMETVARAVTGALRALGPREAMQPTEIFQDFEPILAATAEMPAVWAWVVWAVRQVALEQSRVQRAVRVTGATAAMAAMAATVQISWLDLARLVKVDKVHRDRVASMAQLAMRATAVGQVDGAVMAVLDSAPSAAMAAMAAMAAPSSLRAARTQVGARVARYPH